MGASTHSILSLNIRHRKYLTATEIDEDPMGLRKREGQGNNTVSHGSLIRICRYGPI